MHAIVQHESSCPDLPAVEHSRPVWRHPGPGGVGPVGEQVTPSGSPPTGGPDGGSPDQAGAAASMAAATRNIVGSPREGAMTCTPTGRPSSPTPKGTDMAG